LAAKAVSLPVNQIASKTAWKVVQTKGDGGGSERVDILTSDKLILSHPSLSLGSSYLTSGSDDDQPAGDRVALVLVGAVYLNRHTHLYPRAIRASQPSLAPGMGWTREQRPAL
jgi:hypothetical protein